MTIRAENNILVKPEYGELGWQVINNVPSPYSKDVSVGAYFSNEIRRRINAQMPCNVIFTGEAGISKSYSALATARDVEPNFDSEQIVYTYQEFMERMINLKPGQIILFDEPEFQLGHRSWFLEQQKALVSTMRSGRFKCHPVFLPCINKSLLDKTIRSYLLQYQVDLERRGIAQVYKISPSKFSDDIWTVPFCRLFIELPCIGECSKPWCLSCDDFLNGKCQTLRSKYEHRRQNLQEQRYKQDLEKSRKVESGQLTMLELEDMGYKVRDKWEWNRKNKIDPVSLQVALEEAFQVKLPDNKVSILSRRLSVKYKDLSPNDE